MRSGCRPKRRRDDGDGHADNDRQRYPDGTDYNVVSWTAVANAVSYIVYRTASSGNPSSTGVIASGVSGTV